MNAIKFKKKNELILAKSQDEGHCQWFIDTGMFKPVTEISAIRERGI